HRIQSRQCFSDVLAFEQFRQAPDRRVRRYLLSGISQNFQLPPGTPHRLGQGNDMILHTRPLLANRNNAARANSHRAHEMFTLPRGDACPLSAVSSCRVPPAPSHARSMSYGLANCQPGALLRCSQRPDSRDFERSRPLIEFILRTVPPDWRAGSQGLWRIREVTMSKAALSLSMGLMIGVASVP